MTTNVEPGTHYRAALDWVRDLIKATMPEQASLSTPCSDWDVETLIGHIIATVERATAVGAGAKPFSVPSIVTGLEPTEWVSRFDAATVELWAVWGHEERLAAMVEVPWGTVTGREALMGYAQETIVHGWDLAQATGQPSEGPRAVVDCVLEFVELAIPAENRGGQVPFGPVIPTESDAPPTLRLASWLGHNPAWNRG